jgi:hypothetical protein
VVEQRHQDDIESSESLLKGAGSRQIGRNQKKDTFEMVTSAMQAMPIGTVNCH